MTPAEQATTRERAYRTGYDTLEERIEAVLLRWAEDDADSRPLDQVVAALVREAVLDDREEANAMVVLSTSLREHLSAALLSRPLP